MNQHCNISYVKEGKNKTEAKTSKQPKEIQQVSFVNATHEKHSVHYQTVKPIADSDDRKLLLHSATEAARLIRLQELSSAKLVQACIQHTKDVNDQLNAIVHINYTEALREAKKADDYIRDLDKNSQEFKNLAETLPLLGVPFVSKDNLKTKNFITIAGHPKRVKNPPSEEDAEVIQRFQLISETSTTHNFRFRQSGAILLAITNLPKNSQLWETYNSGGSSGGTAALVASMAVSIGIGNDLGGSVRIPSFCCGIFGLKPTAGSVPLNGMVPEVTEPQMQQLWTIGPICRYAEDLELVYKVMLRNEMTTKRLNFDGPFDMRNISIFYVKELNDLLCEPLQADVKESVKMAVKHFEDTYGLHAQPVEFEFANHTFELFFANATGDRLPDSYMTCLKRTINWLTNKNSDETPLTLILNLAKTILIADRQTINFYRDKSKQLKDEVHRMLGQTGVLLYPAMATTAPFHYQPNFTLFNIIYTTLFNVLGLPAISCPMGLNNHGLPLGIQVIGGPNSEPFLIAVAKEIEKAFGGWVPPRSTK
ncbi:amidase domain-containing protein [Ditylenchus destructor]|uniref:Amidase domain-containing protein n=1 Tax=Ditylenchus destructor TaxID=166010 RepID=A0AAD4N8I6_9BILA|nr:amidase domain-containing protein [Ditylenchus destructor]